MGGTSAMMSAAQFEAAVAGTRIKPLMREAVRRVLVDAEQPADVARDVGVTRQQVHQSVQRVKQVAGLATLMVTLPAEHQTALVEWLEQHGGRVG